LNPLLAAFASAVVLHHAERKRARSRPEEEPLV
jgi:hypothetical protein